MKVAVVGDVGIDFYKNLNIFKPGGIALNFAYNLNRTSNTVSLISVLGTDKFSSILMGLLLSLKIKLNHVQTLRGSVPQQFIVLKKGERKFVGYKPGVLRKWRLTKKDLYFINTQDVVFIPINDGMEHIFNAIKRIDGPIKVTDFSQDYNRADFGKDTNVITKNAKYFDIIFVGGKKKHLKMIRSVAMRYPEKVIILTLGKNGSRAFYLNEEYYEHAKKVKAIDATGAGDAFQAGFLSSWLSKPNISRALKRGVKAAEQVVEHIGSTKLDIKADL